ncbi:DMT family transporter [Natrarchaeobaculum sulfurireducens]|uniref:Permease of the drug/metabolite transporter (DMT) superfamily n=1 Tax=Natrarchaeobaculum sulfurireducens TaxID=2044521 RepID=A0A346PJ05_9EURY|nr:DMT family transporter [Natrarchaeobaculum sulfurireducens]AXR79500.1 Permease of the drug/metabolite transporter (DMT) superfamily [Natrarchaeobaculum sulfurireducens]
MDDETVGIALVLTSAIGFGTLGIFGVLAADEGLSIPTVLALRFALAAVVVWAVLWFRGRFRLLRGRMLAIAFALGAVGYATQSGLYFLGLEFMTAGMVAIVLYTYPAFVVCLVAIVHPSRVTTVLVVALGLSIGGVALITGADPAGADPVGVLVVLGAALAYSLYIVVSQRALLTVDAEILTAFVLPAAAVTFVVFGLGTGTLAMPDGASAWAVALAIAILATVVPVLTFFAGIARIGASRASIISTAEPGVTVALGALVLGEPVTAVTIVGGTLVVVGVILIQREGT